MSVRSCSFFWSLSFIFSCLSSLCVASPPGNLPDRAQIQITCSSTQPSTVDGLLQYRESEGEYDFESAGGVGNWVLGPVVVPSADGSTLSYTDSRGHAFSVPSSDLVLGDSLPGYDGSADVQAVYWLGSDYSRWGYMWFTGLWMGCCMDVMCATAGMIFRPWREITRDALD